MQRPRGNGLKPIGESQTKKAQNRAILSIDTDMNNFITND
jgi:hypothetical protein